MLYCKLSTNDDTAKPHSQGNDFETASFCETLEDVDCLVFCNARVLDSKSNYVNPSPGVCHILPLMSFSRRVEESPSR